MWICIALWRNQFWRFLSDILVGGDGELTISMGKVMSRFPVVVAGAEFG